MIDWENMIRKTRIKFIMRYGTLGTLSMGVGLQKANMPFIMATDAKNIYYNPEMMDMLFSIGKLNKTDDLYFTVAHEIVHIMFLHVFRRGNRNPAIWNIAIDIAANNYLVDVVGIKPKLLNPIIEKKYSGLLAEEIYALLYEELEKSNGNREEEGEIETDEDIRKILKIKGEIIDDHSKHNELSEDEKKNLEEDWKKRVQIAVASDGRGDIPDYLKRVFDEIYPPKKDWRKIIAEALTEWRDDYTFNPPDIRFSSEDFAFPDLQKEHKLEVAVAVDTSGSISDKELKEFMSEVYAIVKSYNHTLVHLIPCDAGVDESKVTQLSGSVTKDEFMKVEITGGGGTDFSPVFEYLEKSGLEDKIKTLIYLTDGDGKVPTDRNGNYPYNVIWVLNNRRPHDEISFGEIIYLEN